jgi:hypothetical protein
MRLDSKVKIAEDVFMQEIDDETILLDIKTEEYFSLNEIGKVFYEILSEKETLVDVLDELENCFEVPQVELQKDLFSFVKALEEKKLLTIL